MCSPGVFYINKFEMAEFGKLYLNLEQVSSEVLGLLYSYTDWKLLLFFFCSQVLSNQIESIPCTVGRLQERLAPKQSYGGPVPLIS